MRKKERKLLIIGSVLAVVSYTALALDAIYFSMVSDPTPFDVGLARVVWGTTLLLYFLYLPIQLSLFGLRLPLSSWPIKGALFLTSGIAFTFLFFDFFPRWPAIFNSDLELLFVLYLTASISFSLSLAGTLASLRARAWNHTIANGILGASAGFVIFGVSWIVVYFE